MTNQTKSLNTQEWVPQSLDVIAGLFDSDGSFGVKTYIGKEGVKFHTNITYSQELLKRDALYGLLLYMGVESEVKISTRNVPSKITGTISTGTRISLAFSSDSGQVLLNRWATIPPCAPSKILDYNIATLLTQLSSVKADVLINRYVNQNIVTDTPIAELACLWLRTKMSGVQRDVKNKKPLKEYYLKLSATKGEIQKSVVIAKTVFEKMQKTIDNQNAQIEQRLTEDYIVGYFIGDGSFSFSHSFNENGNLKFTSAFTITDSVQNFALLKATSKFLVSLGFTRL
jgi:hypothetical protein